MAAPSTSAALAASSRLIALISSSFLPSRHARADSPRSPKLRHTTVTCAPRDAASAIAPPARQTKSPAWALITRTGPFSAAASAVISLPPSRAPGPAPAALVPGPAMSRRDSPRTPHLLRGLDDQPELGPLLFLGEVVTFLAGGEAALRRQAELVGVDEGGRVLDPPFQVVL